MVATSTTAERALLASMLDWWDDAGVHTISGDDPAHWTARRPAAPDATAHKTPESAQPSHPPSIPDTLDALVTWLMTSEEVADFGPLARRHRPAGDAAQARLMILSDMPELDDADGPFTGALAPLFDRMLGALRLTRDDVYVATMVPARTPTAQLSPTTRELIEEAARTHVRLAAPARLWVMGSAASRAIIGVDDARGRGQLHRLNLDGVTVDAIATAHPRLIRPELKELRAQMWADMQRLLPEE